MQAQTQAEKSALEQRITAAHAATAEARRSTDAMEADIAAAESLADERRCQLAMVMDSLAAVQANSLRLNPASRRCARWLCMALETPLINVTLMMTAG